MVNSWMVEESVHRVPMKNHQPFASKLTIFFTLGSARVGCKPRK